MREGASIPEGFARRFEALALEITGVRLSDGWLERAARVLPRQMGERALPTWEALFDAVEDPGSGPALVELLVGEMTVKETRLFRDVSQMKVLSEVVLPEVMRAASHRGTHVRVWSAGCATGEEAYSAAMLLSEVTEDGDAIPFAVLGTDISSSAIAHARRGVYREPAEHWGAGEFLSLLDRYTVARDDGARSMDEIIRARTRFAVHNLMFGLPVLGQDVVLCRNVMVYLPPDARRTLVQRLWDSLNPGGWLLTGEADLIHLVSNGFETWHHRSATLYRRPLATFDHLQRGCPA